MRSILKAAFTIFSTLAIANVMAQCGPRGCGYQGGNSGSYNYPANYSTSYSSGSNNPGYYDQQGQRYHGDPAYQNQGSSGYQQGWGHTHQGGGQYQQGWEQDHQGGGQFPQSRQQNWGGGHVEQYGAGGGQDGYDYPVADHPVTDSSGKQVRYYGKPGPDYNNTGAPSNTQPNPQSTMQKTSYGSYSSNNNNDWGNLANMDSTTGNSTHGGGATPAPTPRSAPTETDTSKSTSTSKW